MTDVITIITFKGRAEGNPAKWRINTENGETDLQLWEDEKELPIQFEDGGTYVVPFKDKNPDWGWTVDMVALKKMSVDKIIVKTMKKSAPIKAVTAPQSGKVTEQFDMMEPSINERKAKNQVVVEEVSEAEIIVAEEVLNEENNENTEMSESTALEISEASLIPADVTSMMSYLPPIEEAKKYFAYVQEFKLSILTKKDVEKIGDKTHVKRSGWEKFVNTFRLAYKIVSEQKRTTKQHLVKTQWDKTTQPWTKAIVRDEILEGIQYKVKVEMTAPNGLTVQGIGLCEEYEGGRDDRKEHDVLTHAETRAFNRACSKIVGLGEVSFEEIK